MTTGTKRTSQGRTSRGGGPTLPAQPTEPPALANDLNVGEVITAEIVRIDFNHVVVNAGLKGESYIDIEEFKNDQGELEVQVGDFVSVAIDAVENGYGDIILSRDKAKRLASWMSLENALESGEFVTGTVSGKVQGGLTVLVNGIRAFLPGSLLDTRPVKDMTPFEGKTMEFKVIKLDRKRGNVVLSRRAVVEASMDDERASLPGTLPEGDTVQGSIAQPILALRGTSEGVQRGVSGSDPLMGLPDAWPSSRNRRAALGSNDAGPSAHVEEVRDLAEEAKAMLPERVRSIAITDALPVRLRCILSSSVDRSARYLIESTCMPLRARGLLPLVDMSDDTFALVAVFPSGALRTVGRLLSAADGSILMCPFSFFDLIDPDVELAMSEDWAFEQTALLIGVYVEP